MTPPTKSARSMTFWLSKDPDSDWVDVWLVKPMFSGDRWHLPSGADPEVDTGSGKKAAHYVRCSVAQASLTYGTVPDDHRMLVRHGEDPRC